MSLDDANQIVREAQRKRRLAGALRVALPTAAALGAGAAIAVAAIPGSGGTITGCYLTNTGNAPDLRIGQLRIIDPSMSPTLPGGGPNPAAACLSDESTITWNQSGPAGPQGPVGATGQAGPAGAPGANGQDVLLPAVQFGFDNSAGPMFLKLEGVEGASVNANFKNDIEISSFSFGAGNTQGSGGGGGAGKTSFSSFTITKPMDKSSPLLQASALSGKLYKDADVLFARGAGQSQKEYLKIELKDAMISSYKTSGVGGDGIPTETFVLDGVDGEATFISGNGASTVLLKYQGGV